MITFSDWLKQLYHRAEIMKIIDMNRVHEANWMKYWEDGYSPREAIREWVSYHYENMELKV